MLKPQDLLVAVHLAVHPAARRYGDIAKHLYLSISVAHRAMASAKAVHLVSGSGETIRPNLVEFLIHGARYVFPARLAGPARGVPTGAAAPMLQDRLAGNAMLVWPERTGRVRGDSLEPIHPSVPTIALESLEFHVILAALDLLRVGSARERSVAAEVIQEKVLRDHA